MNEKLTADHAMNVLKAFVEGKDVGYYGERKGQWHRIQALEDLLFFLSQSSNYVIVKSEPKLVPWTMMDVPLNCWFRYKSAPDCFKQALSIAINSICFTNSITTVIVTYNELLAYYEYTIDNKTWHPCGKEIQS